MYIYIAIILFAAVPLTDKPIAQSVFIALGMLLTAHWIGNIAMGIINNQKKIYAKLSKNG